MHELMQTTSTENEMKEKYSRAGEHLYTKPGQELKITDIGESDVKKTQVVFSMGGAGSRLLHVTRDSYSKHMIPVNWQPLSKYAFDMWRNAGFENFSVLIDDTHRGKSVSEYYGDGKKFGVKIKYSVEHGKLGSAGALKNALENKAISDSMISHFPDDQIINYPNFPLDFLKVFISSVEQGYYVVLLCVPGSFYPYGEVCDKNGKVFDFVEKPFINKDSYTGISGISKKAFPLIQGIDASKGEVKMERVIFKTLAAQGKICKILIPSEFWIPVNDDPSLKRFEDSIKNENSV